MDVGVVGSDGDAGTASGAVDENLVENAERVELEGRRRSSLGGPEMEMSGVSKNGAGKASSPVDDDGVGTSKSGENSGMEESKNVLKMKADEVVNGSMSPTIEADMRKLSLDELADASVGENSVAVCPDDEQKNRQEERIWKSQQSSLQLNSNEDELPANLTSQPSLDHVTSPYEEHLNSDGDELPVPASLAHQTFLDTGPSNYEGHQSSERDELSASIASQPFLDRSSHNEERQRSDEDELSASNATQPFLDTGSSHYEEHQSSEEDERSSTLASQASLDTGSSHYEGYLSSDEDGLSASLASQPSLDTMTSDSEGHPLPEEGLAFPVSSVIGLPFHPLGSNGFWPNGMPIPQQLPPMLLPRAFPTNRMPWMPVPRGMPFPHQVRPNQMLPPNFGAYPNNAFVIIINPGNGYQVGSYMPLPPGRGRYPHGQRRGRFGDMGGRFGRVGVPMVATSIKGTDHFGDLLMGCVN